MNNKPDSVSTSLMAERMVRFISIHIRHLFYCHGLDNHQDMLPVNNPNYAGLHSQSHFAAFLFIIDRIDLMNGKLKMAMVVRLIPRVIERSHINDIELS